MRILTHREQRLTFPVCYPGPAVGWLILCVSLLGPTAPRMERSFWVCLWRCFGGTSRWNPWTAQNRLSAPLWAGVMQSLEALSKTKGEEKRKLLFCFLAACWAGASISPCPVYLIRSPSSQAFRQNLQVHHQLPWVSSLQTRQQLVGLLSIHDCASQLIRILYRYCLPGNPNTHLHIMGKLNFQTQLRQAGSSLLQSQTQTSAPNLSASPAFSTPPSHSSTQSHKWVFALIIYHRWSPIHQKNDFFSSLGTSTWKHVIPPHLPVWNLLGFRGENLSLLSKSEG